VVFRVSLSGLGRGLVGLIHFYASGGVIVVGGRRGVGEQELVLSAGVARGAGSLIPLLSRRPAVSFRVAARCD